MLAAQPVDFRKSVHTLSALVSEALRANPYCGDVFIFRSKRSDRVKLLAWDGSGKDLVFGSRSEKLSVAIADQLALDLADVATDVTLPAAANDDHVPSKPAGTTSKPRKKAQRNIGALPKHLPRCEQVIEPETTACPCCEGRLHKIGEDVNEVLDVIPAILRVLRTIRPKYACRGCTVGVVQATVLPRVI